MKSNTQQLKKEILREWYKKYNKSANYPDLDKIIFYVERNNIFQVLYSFGILNTLILLQYFLDTEQYLDCAEIHKQILQHNKLSGDNLELTLEEHNASIWRKNNS